MSFSQLRDLSNLLRSGVFLITSRTEANRNNTPVLSALPEEVFVLIVKALATMGSTSGGSSISAGSFLGINGLAKKRKYATLRGRQRANLSFFMVVMFFAVFGIIVITEVFFIDDRSGMGGNGIAPRHDTLGYHRRDYEQNEDYISIRAAMLSDDTLGAILVGGRPPAVALPVVLDNSPQYAPKESLLPPYPDNSTLTDGSWQTINGTRFKFFVFSAFYDQRRKGQRIVRVIGATKTRAPERVWCRLWYKANDFNASAHVSVTVQAKVWAIRENWNLKYSACFATCALPQHKKNVPAAVSLVAKPNDMPTNLLVVVNNYNETLGLPVPNRFGVCVKPLHFDYNKEIQILEFIELNRILGIEHFTLYNHTIGKQVDCILKDYVDRGLATILPWNLDLMSQKEIRTEGLFAALNDCLYRSMYKFSHILLIDLDEYIIAKHNDTLPQLIEYLDRRVDGRRSPGAFSFQNAFFYLQWPDDDDVAQFESPVASSLMTLRKTRRKSKLHPHKQRSKYVCRPDDTVEVGNHFVWELMPGKVTRNAPPEVAILHHYRICEFGGNDCIKTSSTIDKTAYRYKDVLVASVTDQYDRLKRRCKLSDLDGTKTKVLSKLFNLLKQ